jgi:hypothetical protein
MADATARLLEEAWNSTLLRRSFQSNQHRQNRGATDAWRLVGEVLAERLSAGA